MKKPRLAVSEYARRKTKLHPRGACERCVLRASHLELAALVPGEDSCLRGAYHSVHLQQQEAMMTSAQGRAVTPRACHTSAPLVPSAPNELRSCRHRRLSSEEMSKD
eukprot:5923460-Pleurochrysis_carterae.AAC.1